jgi:CRISPR-associated protein Cas6
LNLAGRLLRVGVPQVSSLVAATAVRSRLVVIKLSADGKGNELSPPDHATFTAAARRQLDALEIAPAAELSIGKRRTLRIKDKEIVGYEVLVAALAAEESLTLQERGIGGRRHMGCGVFVPFCPRTGAPNDE